MMQTGKDAINQNSLQDQLMQPSYWSVAKVYGHRKRMKFCREHNLTYGSQRQHNNGHVEYSNTSQPRGTMGNKNIAHLR